ncbi:MAG TPA: DUF4115 domain-containing protein, partial [Aggregatilineales bacterium]|nr:DUF4115 domain-containing protein [Aggregatilineales bacterium]
PDAPPIKGATFEDVSLQLTILARTWLRVTVDGVVVYQGMPAPNTVLQYKGRTVTIRAANAIGLRAVVNGQDLGILGVRGQIVEETFTPNAPLGEAPPALPTSVAPATPAGTPTFDPAARG